MRESTVLACEMFTFAKRGSDLIVKGMITSRIGKHEDLSPMSINLLVVYRESVNLIGYITRRLSSESLQF